MKFLQLYKIAQLFVNLLHMYLIGSRFFNRFEWCSMTPNTAINFFLIIDQHLDYLWCSDSKVIVLYSWLVFCVFITHDISNLTAAVTLPGIIRQSNDVGRRNQPLGKVVRNLWIHKKQLSRYKLKSTCTYEIEEGIIRNNTQT